MEARAASAAHLTLCAAAGRGGSVARLDFPERPGTRADGRNKQIYVCSFIVSPPNDVFLRGLE